MFFFLQVSTYHLTQLQYQITIKKKEKLVATQQPHPQLRSDTAIGVSVDGSPSSWYLSLRLMIIRLPAPHPLSGKHNQYSTHPLISPQQEQAPPPLKPLPYQRITSVVCPTNRNPHKATKSTRSSTAPRRGRSRKRLFIKCSACVNPDSAGRVMQRLNYFDIPDCMRKLRMTKGNEVSS